MLIRIVHTEGKATVIEHVCSFCAQEHDLDTSDGAWTTLGWCYLCGARHGAGLDGPRKLAKLQDFLGLTDSELPEGCPPYPQGPR
jgi:hypothetical protein